MNDVIYRQVAIDAIINLWADKPFGNPALSEILEVIDSLPSAEPTLYGYTIELLAYIARVMQKEGITAEQAVNAFDDLGMAVRLIKGEMLQKVEEVIYDHNTGKV